MANIGKSTLAIYRDCLRLVEHVGARTKKATLVKEMVRSEFKKNMKVKDEEKINELRNWYAFENVVCVAGLVPTYSCGLTFFCVFAYLCSAILGLSNYLTHHGLSRLKREEVFPCPHHHRILFCACNSLCLSVPSLHFSCTVLL